MIRTLTIFVTGLVVAACSSGTAASSGPPLPTMCNRAERIGTYLLTWTEQSGTCGKIDPSLVSFNDTSSVMSKGDGGPPPCMVHTDVWSENDCKNERTFTCVTPLSGGSATDDAVAVTHETAAGAARIEGTITISLRGSDGSSCTSTYAVVYVRQ